MLTYKAEELGSILSESQWVTRSVIKGIFLKKVIIVGDIPYSKTFTTLPTIVSALTKFHGLFLQS